MIKAAIVSISALIAFNGVVYSTTFKQVNTKSTYDLNLNSIRMDLKKVRFIYNHREVDGTILRNAFTASCSNGRIVSSRPGWTTEDTEEFILADTKEKRDFLELICNRSVLAKTEA